MKFCYCCGGRPYLLRSKNGALSCKECFIAKFEEEIHEFIISRNLFSTGEAVAVGVSGGKDSSVLAHILNKLNIRYNYGIKLTLIAIDEGIKGYRDDSLEAVKKTQQMLELPLKIVSYEELYGWTMDEIVKVIGRKHNCTYCGVLRRHALEKAAQMVSATKIATGHNADDVAETVIMNILRGDINRLPKCTKPLSIDNLSIPRCKPLLYCYEKEIVLYAKYNKLEYFATECVYAPFAFRGNARTLIKDLENVDSSSILNIIKSAELFKSNSSVKPMVLGKCESCDSDTSQRFCQACVLLQTLDSKFMNKQANLKFLRQNI